MTAPVIVTRELARVYRSGPTEVRALDGVSLTVDRGELLALVGASGSGKSTLLGILGCLDRPTSGTYELDGVQVQDLDDVALAGVRNRKLGMIFQNYNLLPRLRADQNVALPLRYGGVPAKERLERALRALEEVGLADRAHHTPRELSGGQAQRVAIARALVGEPEVLLADEPTGALDSTTGGEILNLFERLHLEGRTVILVTHDPAVADRAQRRVRLKDGRLLSDDRAGP